MNKLITLFALILLCGCTQVVMPDGEINETIIDDTTNIIDIILPQYYEASEVIMNQLDSTTIGAVHSFNKGSEFNASLINGWVDADIDSSDCVFNSETNHTQCSFEIINNVTLDYAQIDLTVKENSTYKVIISVPIYKTHYVYDIFNVTVKKISK